MKEFVIIVLVIATLSFGWFSILAWLDNEKEVVPFRYFTTAFAICLIVALIFSCIIFWP